MRDLIKIGNWQELSNRLAFVNESEELYMSTPIGSGGKRYEVVKMKNGSPTFPRKVVRRFNSWKTASRFMRDG